jgi:hypothetical protein
MKQKQQLIMVILLVSIGLLAACNTAANAKPAQTTQPQNGPAVKPEAPQPAPMPEATIKLTDDGFTTPAEIPAGVVAVNVNNSSTQYQEGAVVLGRLNEGVSHDDITTLLAGDDPDGYTKFDRMVTSLGGGDQRTIYDLKPGQYLAYFTGNIEGAPPISGLITVKDEGNTAVAPTADITAEMQEFAFIMPDEIKADKHLWHISNKGKQVHHMLIMQLPQGVTTNDIITWVSADELSGPPPFLNPDGPTLGGGFESISPGQSAWVEIDLPPGEYTVFCLLPDFTAMPPMSHIAHGMHRILKVVE